MIESENANFEMHVRGRRANEHCVLKRLEGDYDDVHFIMRFKRYFDVGSIIMLILTSGIF